jgi:hypothetical protein
MMGNEIRSIGMYSVSLPCTSVANSPEPWDPIGDSPGMRGAHGIELVGARRHNTAPTVEYSASSLLTVPTKLF